MLYLTTNAFISLLLLQEERLYIVVVKAKISSCITVLLLICSWQVPVKLAGLITALEEEQLQLC